MLPIDFNPPARTLRSFARLWFPLFVGVTAATVWWRFDAPWAATWWAAVGAVVAVVSAASERMARGVFVSLMVVTYPLALSVSFVLLAVIFLIVFTPLGLLLRLRGHDALGREQRDAATHWHRFDQEDSPERAIRQF